MGWTSEPADGLDCPPASCSFHLGAMVDATRDA